MTTSAIPRRLQVALCTGALALLFLGLVHCSPDMAEPEEAEPEEEVVDVEALQLALQEVHDAVDHNPLDDIQAAANRRLREEVRRGTITREEARRVSAAIAGAKARLLAALESGRITMEEACEIFRREIAKLFRALRERKREGRGQR